MKNAAIFLILLLISPFAVKQIFASSSSSTTIINNVSSSNNSTSISNSHTSIHMETNGKVQDYNSDTPGNVHMQSEDGSSTVDINNNTNTTISPFPTRAVSQSVTIPTVITPTIHPDKDAIKKQMDKMKEKIAEQKKQMQAQHENFLQRMQTMLKNLFSGHGFF